MIAKLIGRFLCQPAVRSTLLDIAMRTPDDHIYGPNGEIYMYRYWLFNPINHKLYKRKYPFIPFSIRIHRTMTPDLDRHLHDHPFNAWWWIMGGGYEEVRLAETTLAEPNWSRDKMVEHRRLPGDAVKIKHDEFHKITRLYDSKNGALSLFVFGRYKGPWGFLVNGEKMVRREYERRFKPSAPTACKAVQHSDQTVCQACDLAWDTNDPNRPMCKRRATEAPHAEVADDNVVNLRG
jgi:hypothetical protein